MENTLLTAAAGVTPLFQSTLKKWYKDRGQHNIIKQLLSNRRKKSEEKNDPREFARVMSCDPNAHKTPTHILVPSTASQMLNFTAFPRRESCTGHPQLAAEVWDAHLFIRRQKFHFLGSLILEWEWSSPIWCKSLAFFFFFPDCLSFLYTKSFLFRQNSA